MSEFVPQGPPRDVDPPTHGRIARTFYIYRLLRLAIQSVVLLAVLLVTALGGAPWWAPVLAFFALVLTALRAWQTRKLWLRAQSSFAPSPRA